MDWIGWEQRKYGLGQPTTTKKGIQRGSTIDPLMVNLHTDTR